VIARWWQINGGQQKSFEICHLTFQIWYLEIISGVPNVNSQISNDKSQMISFS